MCLRTGFYDQKGSGEDVCWEEEAFVCPFGDSFFTFDRGGLVVVVLVNWEMAEDEDLIFFDLMARYSG